MSGGARSSRIRSTQGTRLAIGLLRLTDDVVAELLGSA
jgi:hypothetical protein